MADIGRADAVTVAEGDMDATLVARCRRGDGSAWTALVKRYQRLVYTVAHRIGLDEHGAADVFQTVFSRLINHLPRLEDPHRLQAWIVTTAKREALLQRSRSMRTVSMSGAGQGIDGADEPDWDAADDALLPEEMLSNLQQAERVRRALDGMDERCRCLLTMLFSDADERPGYDEVARRLGTPVGSVGPTRSRCLDKLRSLLE